MGRTYETALRLDGKLGPGFKSSMSLAQRMVGRLSGRAKELARAAQAAGKFDVLRQKVEKSKTAFAAAAAKVAKLKAEIQKTDKPTAEMVAEFEAASAEAKRLERALSSSQRTLGRQSAALKKAGVDTAKLALEQKRLERQSRTAAGRARGIGLVTRGGGTALRGARRLGSEARQLGSQAGLIAAAGVYRAGQEVMDVGSALGDLAALPTVTGSQLEAFHKAGIEWARKHGTAVEDSLGTTYMAVSADITDTTAAIEASQRAYKMATVTRGDPVEAINTLARVYNATSKLSKVPAPEWLAHIGDLLAYTQQRFHIENLTELGDAMKYALPAQIQYGIPMEQVTSALGVLSTKAGRPGSLGGTGLQRMASRFMKAEDKESFGKYGFKRVFDDKTGALDLLKTVSALRTAINAAKADGKNAGDMLSKAFGDRAVGAISGLLENMVYWAKMIRESTGVGGTVDKSFAAYEKAAAGPLALRQIKATFDTKMYEIGMKLIPMLSEKMPDIIRLLDRIPDIFDDVWEAGSKIWGVVESLGGLQTVLYVFAGAKMAGVIVGIGQLALGLGGVVRGLGNLSGLRLPGGGVGGVGGGASGFGAGPLPAGGKPGAGTRVAQAAIIAAGVGGWWETAGNIIDIAKSQSDKTFMQDLADEAGRAGAEAKALQAVLGTRSKRTTVSGRVSEDAIMGVFEVGRKLAARRAERADAAAADVLAPVQPFAPSGDHIEVKPTITVTVPAGTSPADARRIAEEVNRAIDEAFHQARRRAA